MAAQIGKCESKKTKEIYTNLGLIAEHAYSIMEAAQIKDKNGEAVNLVKLRNPQGKFEWNGKWSDQSDEWTPELRE